MKALKVDDFLVERWMNTYEYNVEVNLAETCVEPFTLREYLEFVDKPDFFDNFKHKKLKKYRGLRAARLGCGPCRHT